MGLAIGIGLVIILFTAALAVREVGKNLEDFTDPYTDTISYSASQYDQVTDIDTIRAEGTVEAQGTYGSYEEYEQSVMERIYDR